MGFKTDFETLKALEWEKILNWVSDFAVSEGGKKRIFQEAFASDLTEIKKRQAETLSGRVLQEIDPSFSTRIGLKNLLDPSPHLTLLSKGGVISPSALIEIRSLTSVQVEARNVFQGAYTVSGKIDEIGLNREEVTLIRRLVLSLPDMSRINRMINRVIEDWTPSEEASSQTLHSTEKIIGRVKDSASPELSGLRSQEKKMLKKISDAMRDVLDRAERKGILQDRWSDVRSGRYVIPIKDEFQHDLQGSVMESSITGATVYIEPAEVVEMTNQLRRIQISIESEAHRILSQLSAEIRPECGEILEVHSGLIELDFWMARGAYSQEILGATPEFSEEGSMSLIRLFHPLLLKSMKREEIISNDFSFQSEEYGVLLSGPNSGGKTVLMKSLGVCILSLLYGVQIAASEKSQIYPYRSLFCDLGDSQSIENNLSSFSGRIKNIKRILEGCKPDSLVLIDEILAATDPEEASALAQSLIEEIGGRGSKLIVTTHFEKLKIFAAENKRFMNGSMEFNQENLEPTYRYRSGIPGRSMALEIAGRHGLSSSIINRARELLGGHRVNTDELLKSLNEQYEGLKKDRVILNSAQRELEVQKKHYESEIFRLLQEKKKAVQEKKEELLLILKKAEKKIAEEFVKQSQKGALKAIDKIARETRSDLSHGLKSESEEVGVSPSSLSWEELHIGQSVFWKRQRSNVEILALYPEKSKVQILAGILKVEVSIGELELRKGSSKKSIPSVHVDMDSASTSLFRLDIRGERYEAAMKLLEKHLDQCLSEGIEKTSVVHGHGLGALKEGIRAYLKSVSQVKKFNPAPHDFGGDGVTEIYFI